MQKLCMKNEKGVFELRSRTVNIDVRHFTFFYSECHLNVFELIGLNLFNSFGLWLWIPGFAVEWSFRKKAALVPQRLLWVLKGFSGSLKGDRELCRGWVSHWLQLWTLNCSDCDYTQIRISSIALLALISRRHSRLLWIAAQSCLVESVNLWQVASQRSRRI